MAENLENFNVKNESEIDSTGTEAWRDLLMRAGVVGASAFGVQYDLNAAWRNTDGQIIGASFCNQACVAKEDGGQGNYTCLAAFTLNRGIMPRSLTPADVIIGSLGKLEAGIDEARRDFFNGQFQAYCDAFHIAANVAAGMQLALDQPGFEFNAFGGNPELHPELPTIIKTLRESGKPVHLTTTGGRIMRDAPFRERLLANPPTLMALSADDFDSADDIYRLAGLSFDQLHAEWKLVPVDYGQRRKAYEAIYAAKWAQQTPGAPPVLFNMVIHAGNVHDAPARIAALAEAFEGVLINPFPAQSAFSYSEPALRPEHAPPLKAFIDDMITIQVAALHESGNGRAHPFVWHLHYWLMLRAVFDWAGDNNEQAMRMIAGDGIWQCYRDSPAGFYVQIGLGPDGQVQVFNGQHPGGSGGCFWNRRTVTDPRQLWDKSMTADRVRQYIQVGKRTLAAASSQPCRGCAFPRLTSHIISTETGMDPRLLPFYFERRAQALGF